MIPKVFARGVEFSYDIAPRNDIGLGGFFTYTNLVNVISGGDQSYTDHDQLNTLTFGLDYQFKSGLNFGVTVYHGSGVASSVVRDGGSRTPRTQVNLRLSSGSTLFGKKGQGGINLDIENLFDERSVINFHSAFSGTRFQQGRRIQLSANYKF